MVSAKETILASLRSGQGQGKTIGPGIAPVDPLVTTSLAELRARFVDEAQSVGVAVHAPQNPVKVFELLGKLIGEDKEILGWGSAHIPVTGLDDWLEEKSIRVEQSPKDGVRLGITGVDAALAATGSLVLLTGAGKGHAASLLPDVHVAIVARWQIVANLEAWRAQVSPEAVQAVSNVAIITGPSRTADIGMELVMGAHGPREVHVVLV